MRAGRALRDKWEMERLAAKLCECGHREGDHFELRDVMVVRYGTGLCPNDGVPSFERHPDHVVGEFHCNHEGCDCIIRR